MARKTKEVPITTAGRDQGKTFFITEMPPRQAERWATRLLLAVAKANGEDARSAEEIAGQGVAGLLTVGIRSLTGVAMADAEPLLDEMLSCVMFIPDPAKIDQTTMRPLVRPVDWDNDVEEVATIAALRSEVIEVHTGFSPAGFLSTLGKTAKAKLTSPPIRTSRKRSGSSSGRASPP